MLMALHWIKDNIDAFGGDPDLITLYGQDAGSIAISLMCVSPLFEGLFKRVILHSGTFVSFKENHFYENLKLSQRLAEAVGCSSGCNKTIYENPEDVVACLRSANATDLAVTLNSFDPTAHFAFYPDYNAELFPYDPVQALKDGLVHDVDVVIGGSYTEGSFLLPSMYPEEFGVFGKKDNGGISRTFAETILRDAFGQYSEPETIVDHFLKGFKGDHYELRNRTYTALGDDRIFCPLVYFAEKYGDHTNKVHFFEFGLHPFGYPWADWMESVHFNNGPYLLARPLAAKDVETSGEDVFRHATVSFAMRLKFIVFTITGHVDIPGRVRGYVNADGTLYNGNVNGGDVGLSRATKWDSLLFNSTSRGYNFFNDSAGQDPLLTIEQTYLRYDPEKSNCDFLRTYHGF